MATGDFYYTTSATSDSVTTWNTWTIADGTSTDVTWNNWVIVGNSFADSTTTSITWTNWVGDGVQFYNNTWVEWVDAQGEPGRLSDEQRARIQEAKEAEERADNLLREHLTAEQKAQLEKDNGFEVESASGKKYLITRGRTGNVYSLDAQRRKLASHCIHPVEVCPDQDTMLAQMLWLKWNEEEFLRVANTTRLAA